MAILGARALVDLALPTGIDGSAVLRWQLRDGATGPQVIGRAATIIGEVNQRVFDKYAGLLFVSTDLYGRSRAGSGTKSRTPLRAEFVKPDPIRGQDIGHMWLLKDYADAVGWTPLYLRDAYMPQLDADLREIADRWETRVGEDIWTRVLTDDENLLPNSTTGYSVGWAIGTGTNVNYIPPQYGATVHTSSHTHYVWKDDDSATWRDLLDDMVTQLRHHGIGGRLVCFCSGSDLAEWEAITGFVELNANGITVVAGSTSAPVRIAQGEFEGMPGELFGYVNTVRGVVELRYDDFIPTNYCFLTKSYGSNNPRNPMAVRVHPTGGFGLVVDPQITQSINPELDHVQFNATHGINVNDRLAGVAGYLNAAATQWVDATVVS
ncbi:MAG: hypothetical protein EHM39_07665 [Chloroflexi bacterium]|nr:MAG: hypothetical protein EHM39_07665 [Chloroflexota bacterium]